jgi:uncharacterized membrane protein
MEPTFAIVALWLVFGGTHVGLATRPVRERLVARFGEHGFALLFSLIAAVSFALLVHYYAAHRHEGLPGPALGAVPALRGVLVGLVVAGVALIVAGVAVYPSSPMAPSAPPRPPRGLARVTRHPFLVGVFLFATAHALLATRLDGTVLFGGFALLASLGAWHQDRKLLRARGQSYAAYVAATSALPFAAVLAGRQRIAWRELPLTTLAAGLLSAVLLRHVHAGILSHGGAWVIWTTVGLAGVFLILDWWRARSADFRPASRAARAP